MNRYSVIESKFKREIVLLKGFPCVWGKCTFCDYILDNSTSEEEINKINFQVLKNITGKYKVLEVINSGSCFELPKKTLERIKEIIEEKSIEVLFLESHWCYKGKIKEMREYFKIPIIFKIGVETFDYKFRNEFLNKNAKFKTVEELKQYFDSPCIMVGIKGQSKKQIDEDINIVLNNFNHATINVFVENSTSLERDGELVNWFKEKYSFLNENSNIEVLYNNTDFGVGD
ncbi:radical SAM protein [Clostridium niameyense]|uniref:Radical SAM protein n=1 Tax=Clostridium niameyense TaxID=1622073 RepID=A0A6M0R9K6_9CLOT|nr:radical SAM protein [Clostridium niameyense]NEZ46340.1 radical SAM protein [Clostridium niameyense]